MFYALILAVIVLVAAGIGFVAGVSKRDEITKTRDLQYKEAVKSLDVATKALLESSRKNTAYERGLRDIAAGRGIAEFTAQYALNEANN